MAARGLRSSARLSGGGGAAPERASPSRSAAASAAAGRVAAAERRARAAERAREVEDSPRVLRDKCRRLARALRNAKHLVVYTGAGISTAADIPDYRGPRGVWTRLQRGETVRRVEVSRARPTFTHMALTALWARGALKFVVSQNCDGLHLRSGLPRRALAELHGDMYAERCAACRRVYLRAFDTTERTARHHHATRRLCHACGAELADSIVHFGERGCAAWPLNWAGALRHAARADVVLCLGSSLKVLRRYPRLWRMQSAPSARPRLYIVNLQWTPKDSVAALKINARCDAVMRAVARRLRLRVPRYRPARDPLLAHAEPLAPPEAHTSRRPPLAPPPPSPPRAYASSAEELGSPSASDSDEELPLLRLADRLRRVDCLRAFRVNMHSGEATILLRPEHAPPEPRAAPSPPAAASRRLAAEPPPAAASRRLTAELRRVRFPKRRASAATYAPPTVNGHATPAAPAPVPLVKVETNGVTEQRNGSLERDSKLRRLLGPRVDSPQNGERDTKPEVMKLELKPEPKLEPKPEGKEKSESSGDEGSARTLAAAIIARAVLLCRGSLYPGLHTILAPPAAAPAAPPPAAPPPAECGWCARRYGSRRCLWYGPPRLTAAGARAWRRVRGRRYLCACCGHGEAGGEAESAGEARRGDEDGGGWYGKGYRKGRRRRGR